MEPLVRWRTMTAGAGCRRVTTRLTGLASGQAYAFWLEATVLSAESGVLEQRQVDAEPPVVAR
ncbi:hypothetical protein [Arthrobacter sp. NEB 688]|uniref:hypothetical protein n=1 Tax=Arthrobacter sp. NEB 688 TaxID=904039 RepID=UPI001567BF2D|nr:hypothetical protein [Arthrobacter sp. NEB 688]QKE84655.1 hypothetical protein HL663_12380 [Arthrobacter sp. NEB 688]